MNSYLERERGVKWDVFCKVVDNYGDIGVTWRLARQLVADQGAEVRLWVDDLAALARICPQADAESTTQRLHGVEVRHWAPAWQATEPADVVIEAFACDLPADYVAAMAARPAPILWLNLEYLSAEGWVEGCHGLPSMQSNGLQKFFFFPGFTAGTGGLLREQSLLSGRDALQSDTGGRERFLESIGVRSDAGTRLVSLFAYENAALAGWLDALASDAASTHLLVPEGRILGDLQHWLGQQIGAGAVVRRGALSVQVLPFMQQDQYDALLWCCDLNLVRGEDSFVRAQWAGRPLVWHIYPQEEGAHWDKLEAFIALYCQGLSAEASAALRAVWQAWNAGEPMNDGWNAWLQCNDELAAHAQEWAKCQAVRADLAAALVQFYRNWL
ncbi:elongation factor P maturation arginine rhamnosyltransferase EarP [Pseudomonas sp. MM211]|uniref:elongation factor P maturation arginine rhamnosyltransferase EarP n=1 Tax=Pseudomonas sp. MM211 TaxID=2866808 RepID=UPI001CEDD3B1|nr:elongation factor P maturation arginine rhamnosyltransferase EarP [Pseudomonas sp. MM211]UCJ15856.1 elongation factor P maturation arginine rhamnosyltransferase EarP [Pseudomonas sp. MM211]